jgi:hypothetical protein
MMYWPGIIGAPVVFLTLVSAAYALVSWACRSHDHVLLDIVSAFALLLTLGATLLGGLAWRRTRAHGGTPLAVRKLFLAELAIALGAISSVAVLAQWSTRLALSPCIA